MDQYLRKSRLVIRRSFGGVAELTDLKSGRYLVSKISELDGSGCFATTRAPFPLGAKISLKIHFKGAYFEAVGSVTYASPDEGMGILYEPVSPRDARILSDWLFENTEEVSN